LKIALFLGAGASVTYDKPTTSDLRDRLIKKYGSTVGRDYLQTLLACDEFEDIEHILQTMKDLTILKDQYGGKFLYWLGKENRMVIGMDGRNHPYSEFVDNLDKVKLTLENEVFQNYSWNYKFDDIVNTLLTPVFDLLQSKSDEIVIFTTNYDRAIEEYCSKDDNRYFCVDGFKLHHDSARFIWNKGDFSYADAITDKTKVFLFKLHGSLNWKKHTRYGIERTTYERKPTDPNYEEDFLIYPTLSPKEESNGREPYNAILKKFDDIMKSVDVCIVIGFSFRDDHINEIFKTFIANGKIFIVFSPSAIPNYRLNLMQENLSEEELESLKGEGKVLFIGRSRADGPDDRNVHLVQKPLSVTTVNEIVRFIGSKIGN